MGLDAWNGGHKSDLPVKGPWFIYGKNWWLQDHLYFAEEPERFEEFWLSQEGLAWNLKGE